MKAVVFSEYGSPEVLRLRDVPKPTPTKDQVLIRVRAASLNAADWRMMRAAPFLVRLYSGILRPKRITSPGSDVAGEVEAVGQEVTRFRPGDEVFGEVSASNFGACAEYKCALETELEHKPTTLSFEEAAAVPMAAMTALQGLRDVGCVRVGQHVLVQGASGGVGTFALQLAKHLGAEVTAVCSTHKLERARALGADHVIDYTQEDYTRSGRRYDVIVVVNGYHPLRDYQRALAADGRLAFIGGKGTGGEFFKVMLLGPLLSLGRRKIALVSSKPNVADLRLLKELAEAGRLQPVIDCCYPLRETADAMRHVEAGHAGGKVIVVAEAP